MRYQKFVWSQRLFLFSTNSASDSFGSATDHGPKILRFVLPEIREKMHSVQERWDALFDSDLRDFGLTAWKTWLACMRFSMYCPRTVFSDLSRRFSSLTWPTNQRWVLWFSTPPITAHLVHPVREVVQRVLQLQHLGDQPRLLLLLVLEIFKCMKNILT